VYWTYFRVTDVILQRCITTVCAQYFSIPFVTIKNQNVYENHYKYTTRARIYPQRLKNSRGRLGHEIHAPNNTIRVYHLSLICRPLQRTFLLFVKSRIILIGLLLYKLLSLFVAASDSNGRNNNNNNNNNNSSTLSRFVSILHPSRPGFGFKPAENIRSRTWTKTAPCTDARGEIDIDSFRPDPERLRYFHLFIYHI